MTTPDDVSGKIIAALQDRQDLIAVYLFGSAAQGSAHALSDVDVAVLFVDSLPAKAVFAHTLEIGTILEGLFPQPVDVVALNRAPPFLRFQVIKTGKLLLERDRAARCLFVMRALNQYYDAKPYLDYQAACLVARIAREGLGRGTSSDYDALAQARRVSARLAATAGRRAG